jgi:class 3 adenylate cyclase
MKESQQKVNSIEQLLRAKAAIEEKLNQFQQFRCIMFTDIKDSTQYFSRKGDMAGRNLIRKHNNMLFRIIKKHGGEVIKTIGDAIMATFDDSGNAVKSAIEMQRKLARYNQNNPDPEEEIHIRIGINAGVGIIDAEDVYGNLVNIAARVEALADGDQIYITEAVYNKIDKGLQRECQSLGKKEIRGTGIAQVIYEFVWQEKVVSEESHTNLVKLKVCGQARPQPTTKLTLATKKPVERVRKPTKIVPNPFGDRGRIIDPNRFSDREEILYQIFEELNKGVNISLVGESAVGKSSVLSMVCEQRSDRMPNYSRSGLKFVYFNMEWIENENEFYDALCDEFGIDSCRGYKFTRALRGKQYILCLDEIEKMAWDGFTIKVRSHLRGLADGPGVPLKLVIASRSPLVHLFPDSPELDSPLAGICHQIDVKPFSPTVAREFLLHRLEGTGVSFTEAQINDLINKTDGHPAKLQDEAAKLYRELQK